METTEKIVESYCRYVKGLFTIPNIKCSGQQEIDLLAIDANNPAKERYHIETSVSISSSFAKLTANQYCSEKAKQRTQQASQRRTIGFFIEKKFGAESVKNKLLDYDFKEDLYKKVIVTMGWNDDVVPIANENGILLWDFGQILKEIVASCENNRTYFIDDTLRTLQLYIRTKT